MGDPYPWILLAVAGPAIVAAAVLYRRRRPDRRLQSCKTHPYGRDRAILCREWLGYCTCDELEAAARYFAEADARHDGRDLGRADDIGPPPAILIERSTRPYPGSQPEIDRVSALADGVTITRDEQRRAVVVLIERADEPADVLSITGTGSAVLTIEQLEDAGE